MIKAKSLFWLSSHGYCKNCYHLQADPACHPHNLFFFLSHSKVLPLETPGARDGAEAAHAAGMARTPLGRAHATGDGLHTVGACARRGWVATTDGGREARPDELVGAASVRLDRSKREREGLLTREGGATVGEAAR